MIKSSIYFTIATLVFIGQSCKKSSYNTIIPHSSLNVINAAPDAPSVNVNFNATPSPYYLYQNPTYYGSGTEWGMPVGDDTICLVSSADTTHSFFVSTLKFANKGIYSLYILSGSGKEDILFMQDTIPVLGDSSAGVRFINLSPDSKPITINLQGNNPTQTEFSPLSYKMISSFKSFSTASNALGSYNFEIRDKATQALLGSFTWYYTFQRCNTVVISGSVDPASSTPVNIFSINNF